MTSLLSAHHLSQSSSLARNTIPAFLYGTAWKKERTADLVSQALRSGFQGIDTAAQPKHYRENLVGEGVRQVLSEGNVKREDLFIQTKFTAIHGQDSKAGMPYDSRTSVTEQVRSSIASSLHNFRCPSSSSSSSEDESYLDCVVLHSPLPTFPQTLEAWRALESFVPSRVHFLGISNTSLPILEELCNQANVKPSIVQNRFYPSTRFDVPLRRFCRENHIVFQSFWTLTANPGLLRSAPVTALAEETGVSVQESLYAFVLGLEGVTILNGTTNEGRMQGDLEGVKKVDEWREKNEGQWMIRMREFKNIIGEP